MRLDLRTSKKKERPNICIITSPRPKAGVVPLSNLVDLLYPLSSDLYVITGNEGDVVCRNRKEVHGYSIACNKPKTQIIAFNYIYFQLRISYRLMKLTRNVDICVFFMAEGLLLPVLTLRLLGKPAILSIVSSALKIIEARKDISLRSRITKFLEITTYIFSNRIILHSPNIIKEWGLEKYENKIGIAHEYFLDFDKFKIKKEFDERGNLVGYIGRLSEEKGVLNFIKAIPEILEERNGIKFLIGGDGQLQEEIEGYLVEENLNDKVELTGWVPHNELPDYLNELKLLVIPSYTESGPLIALEAMSCGTPILATRVGHVLNRVEDGATGFILKDNSPECIAENIERALNYPDLERIVKNARELVERDFTYDAAVDGYRKILEDVLQGT